MKTSWRAFTVAAILGISILAVADSSAHAQYRRPAAPALPPAVRPMTPRAPIVVPPVTSQINPNPYVLPGMTLTQLGTYSALSLDPTLSMNLRLYNNLYNPYRYSPYYVPYLYGASLYPYTTGIVPPVYNNNPFGFYNPYFASFGLNP